MPPRAAGEGRKKKKSTEGVEVDEFEGLRGGEDGGSHDGPANFGRRRRRSAREGEREIEPKGRGGGIDREREW